MTSNQFFLAQLHERSHGQYVKKWSGLYSNKAFLQKQICGLQLDRAQWVTVSKIYLLSELWKVGRKEARQGTLGGSIFLSQGIQRAMQEISLVREGNGTPLQYSCLENPMDGGAWQAVVHGVARSRTRLSDFTFTFHFHALEKEMATHSVFLPGESQGRGSLVGCCLWGRTESDTTEATQQQQQQQFQKQIQKKKSPACHGFRKKII